MRPVILLACVTVGYATRSHPRRAPLTDSLCLTGEVAAHLRDIVGRVVVGADSIDRAMADSFRLRVGARVRLVDGRSEKQCRAAAEAYARQAQSGARPVVLVVVLRVGDRFVVGDTATTWTSEWALAVVFTRDFRLRSRFLF